MAMGKQVLVLRPANVPQTGRSLYRLKVRSPDAQITLLLSAQGLKHFSKRPLIDRLCTYDTASDGVFRTATKLIRSLRRQHCDLLVILSAPLPGSTIRTASSRRQASEPL